MTREVNTGLHRKQTKNVIFNEVPERVIKNLDLFTNKAEFEAVFFRTIETKRWCYANYIGSDGAPHTCE